MAVEAEKEDEVVELVVMALVVLEVLMMQVKERRKWPANLIP